jgi:hypothetical protein
VASAFARHLDLQRPAELVDCLHSGLFLLGLCAELLLLLPLLLLLLQQLQPTLHDFHLCRECGKLRVAWHAV